MAGFKSPELSRLARAPTTPVVLRQAPDTMTIAVPVEPPSHVKLPSGDLMPTLGLGCWQSTPEELSEAVAFAIKSGYKHIDGATIYGNEKALGEGIKRSGAKREDLWITTKLWNSASTPPVWSQTTFSSAEN